MVERTLTILVNQKLGQLDKNCERCCGKGPGAYWTRIWARGFRRGFGRDADGFENADRDADREDGAPEAVVVFLF
jgi:hypothetical protein